MDTYLSTYTGVRDISINRDISSGTNHSIQFLYSCIFRILNCDICFVTCITSIIIHVHPLFNTDIILILMSSISSQISSILFVFAIVHATKHIDLKNQDNIFWIRFVYFFSQFLLYALAIYVRYRIKRISDKTKIQVTEKQNPLSSEPPKVTEMTIMEYDLKLVQEFIRQTTISLCILLFMHYKWEFIQPLIIQSILPLKAAIFLPIFQIHLLRRPAEGDLKRPFKPPTNQLGEWMEQQKQQFEQNSKPQQNTIKAEPLPTKKD